MKLGSLVAIATAGLLVTACSTEDVETLRTSDVSGTGFHQKLAAGYRGFSTYELDKMYDAKSAEHFAQKGLTALKGQPVAPEDPAKWNIDNPAKMEELQAARARLISALASDAAKKLPGPTASAQVNYDCWVEQQEEGFQYADIGACRNGFFKDLRKVEASLKQKPVGEKPMPAEPTKPVASAPTDFRVFFDWDSAKITPEAADILRHAAQNAKKSSVTVIRIVGYADRSGAATYNQGLSERRAAAVARQLAKDGISTKGAAVYGEGERNPLVPTGDGVREVQNRRVHVILGSPSNTGA